MVYSSPIFSSDANSTLGQILQQAGVSTVQFFIDGIETKTSGLDYLIAYKNLLPGPGRLGFNLAGNVALQNEIAGPPADLPAIRAAGSSSLNTPIKSLLT